MAYNITTAYERIKGLKSRIKVLQGGTSAGKTIAVLLLLLEHATTSKKVITVTSESLPHLKKGALRDFLNILQEQRGGGTFYNYYVESYNKADNIFTLKNGSIIEFVSFADSASARGSRRDILFINECNLIDFETFNELYIRTKEDVYLDFNPVSEFWVHTEILAKKNEYDAEHIILTYKDNEGLDKTIIDAIESKRGDETSNWWRVYGLGQVGSLEGNVYSGWVNTSDLTTKHKLKRYGLDFGFSGDETGFLAVYENEKKELFIRELIYKKGILPSEYVDELKNVGTDPAVPIVADSARPEIIAEIKQGGFLIVPAKKDAGSVLRGIERVQSRSIKYQGKNLEREYLTYAWRKKRTGEVIDVPQDGNDHLLDALRYAVDDMHKPIFDF